VHSHQTINKYTSDNKPLISDTLQGTIVGGIIGFVSSIVVDYTKNWINRPKISIIDHIELTEFSYPVSGFISKGEFTEIEYHESQTTTTEFTGIRIKVENNGNTAAEDCKATLFKNNNELRVGWMIPKGDYTVTINADDSEYIDLCAVGKSSIKYVCIFTTEHGYGHSQHDGRDLENWKNNQGIIEAKLKVSSRNAKASIRDIWISSTPEEGQIVHFNKI
jgi:hypothetical protein